jgi:hypothetical protein
MYDDISGMHADQAGLLYEDAAQSDTNMIPAFMHGKPPSAPQLGLIAKLQSRHMKLGLHEIQLPPGASAAPFLVGRLKSLRI